jgi:hypothetical protein
VLCVWLQLALPTSAPEGRNQFGDQVIGGVLNALIKADLIKPAPPPGTLELSGGDPD